MLKTVFAVFVAGIFVWLILKTIAQVLKSRTREQERRLKSLELELEKALEAQAQEAEVEEEIQIQEDDEIPQSTSSHGDEMAAKWKREVAEQFQNIRVLRKKAEEQDQTIQNLEQKIEEQDGVIKELEAQLVLLEQETPLAQILGQIRKTGGVFLRQHPVDETRVEAGGIEVVTIMNIADAHRFFGEDILGTLEQTSRGDWVEGRLKETAGDADDAETR